MILNPPIKGSKMDSNKMVEQLRKLGYTVTAPKKGNKP